MRVIGPLFLLNFIGATVIGPGLLVPASRMRFLHPLLAFGGIGLAATSFVFHISLRGDAVDTLNSMVQSPTTVDRAFAALADPTRRAVLERLGSGSATISELAEPFGMSLTGMKKHVRLMEEAELVTTEKVGRVRRCMLVPHAFEGISTWLARLDRFAQVVERTKGAA